MNKLPTSNIEQFREHLANPNKAFTIKDNENIGEIAKVQKNLVLAIKSDDTGCGFYRIIMPLTYINSVFGKSGKFNSIILPSSSLILQHDILIRTRSLYIQRLMAPQQLNIIQQYKQLQQKYAYKICYEIDDYIFKGDEPGEEIPSYNFGSQNITDDVRKAAVEIMNLCDTVTVTTDFLGQSLKKYGVTTPTITLPNTIAQYQWGYKRKKLIKEKIEKPKVIYAGSPCHYHSEKRLLGDWDNCFLEFVLKNVKDNKIDFTCMGGMPYFLAPIKNKIKIISWVNSYQYPLSFLNIKSDFSLGPLVPNWFNASKSDIKAIESYAAGSVFIGSVFDNIKSPSCWNGSHMPSPYDSAFLKIQHDAKFEDINNLFWEYTHPEKYNSILTKQYNYMFDEGRFLESEKAIKRYTDIL